MKKGWIVAVALLALFTTATVASAQKAAGEVTQTKVIHRGVSFLQSVPSHPLAPTSSKAPQEADLERRLMKVQYPNMSSGKPLGPAQPSFGALAPKTNVGVTFGGTEFTVNGLDNIDNSSATSGLLFGGDLEPPDQGLCAGNGFVIEAVNNVFAVYDQSGNQLSIDVPTAPFFDVPNSFISDPRCYYDPTDGRFYFTETDVEDFDIAPPLTRSFIVLAVSEDANPFDGFDLLAVDTSDDGLNGTPKHVGCPGPLTGFPCFGDQPLIGADKFGFYITTNEFNLLEPFFNGAQIYAFSKADLEGLPNLSFAQPEVHFANLSVGGGLAASVQPATSPVAGGGEPNEGTEFFLSALNRNFTSDNRIGVWAMTNTESLNSTPNLALQNIVVKVKPYEEPGSAAQEADPDDIPLGQAIGDPEETLSADDNRMQQVVFSGERLYGALTGTIFDGTEFVDGIETFVLEPSFHSGLLKAKLDANQNITVEGQNLIYPAIGITEDDLGAMTFTIAGPNFFPTAAFLRVNSGGATGLVHIIAQGQDPDDGFTGYAGIPSNQVFAGRWGDYSAAVADGEHNVFIATEYISGVRRDLFVNWATSMSEVKVK
ncbi:MAG: hypothetical protein ACRD50_16595 [Candidatus Acidiferrales bacterium]